MAKQQIPFKDITEKDKKELKSSLGNILAYPKAVISIILSLALFVAVGFLARMCYGQFDSIGAAVLAVAIAIWFPIVILVSGINNLKPPVGICRSTVIKRRNETDTLPGEDTRVERYYLKVQFENGNEYDMEVQKAEYDKAKKCDKVIFLKTGKKSFRYIFMD